MPAVMTTQMLTKNSATATIVVLVARFTIFPVLSACNWLPTDGAAHHSFKVDAQQLELTR
jgi:hypothetical protein